MIIIGEKINGTTVSTAKAIQEKNEAYIRNLAIKQTEFGADYLDLCAGTNKKIEVETLKWLIDIVQDTVDTPICINSTSCDVIMEVLPFIKKPGMINSISEENGKADRLLPEIAHSPWNVIALTCDNRGILPDGESKLKIAVTIIEKAKKLGISEDRLFIDPLVITISTSSQALFDFTETLKNIKQMYPDIHTISSINDISYGLPLRKALNQQFLTLAMAAGLDSAIIDPTTKDMQTTLYMTQALLGNDKNCRKYLSAFEKGLIGPKK